MKKSKRKNTTQNLKKASQIYENLRNVRPTNITHLTAYLRVFLDISLPAKVLCSGHASPAQYLSHSFFADFKTNKPQNADAVIWANRAGGKTQLAAAATLLDSIFKPNCHTRILAGSGDQASRMYDYLVAFINKGFQRSLDGPIRKNKCSFKNGSTVEVLTQSAASVRGRHVQKLRCDEVELFDEDVFSAAKFTTLTAANITPAMEIISTMHKPYGLMQKCVTDAMNNNTKIFKWCIFETIEKCTDRNCSQCPLWSYCRSKAKNADGFLKIDDILTAMKRSSIAAFQSEMLCIKPSLENVVFEQFDPDQHVKDLGYDPSLPIYRTIDFGFVNPFVCLWIQTDPQGNIYVIDEYIRSRLTINTHAEHIKARTPVDESNVTATFCDPAGAARNDVTGSSSVAALKQNGIRTKFKKSSILEGIELVRAAIKSGDGKIRLFISPKCPRLIEALVCYHYPSSASARSAELPLKDGIYDHPIDALRYFFINSKRSPLASARY